MSRDFGLLIMRLGLGIMFLYHGYPKISGGPEKWTWLGQQMQVFGVAFLPVFWGFMAAVSEFVGALCLISGFAFRIACALMAFTMLVAASMHLHNGDGLQAASHAIELLVVLVALLFTGAGKFSVADKLDVPFLR